MEFEDVYCPFHECKIGIGPCMMCDEDAARNLSVQMQPRLKQKSANDASECVWTCYNNHLNSIVVENCEVCNISMVDSQLISRVAKNEVVDNPNPLRKVQLQAWNRARGPKKGNKFDSQSGRQCGKHSLNNLLGLEVFGSSSTGDDSVSVYSNPFIQVNLNVVHNYIYKFGLDMLVRPDPLRAVPKENYSFYDLLLALAFVGYSVDDGIGWMLDGNYFKSETNKFGHHKKNVAGWLIHTGVRGEGHWTCIKYDGRNKYYSVDSIKKGQIRTHIPSQRRALLVYYDYIVNPTLVDNGHPSDDDWWKNNFKRQMDKLGYCHHMDIYGKPQGNP